MNYDFSVTKNNLQKVTDWLSHEYGNIHTGQANPLILDSIKIDSYGSFQPIKNIASITIEDARTLRINPWDKNQVGAIDKAIISSDLGLSVSVDGSGMRVVFPQLTEENRIKLVKVLKLKLEEARVSVRKERERVLKDIESLDFSQDEQKNIKEVLQKNIDEINKKLEDIFKQKEISVLKI